MVTVSERAKERLFEQKEAANFGGAEVALRVAAGPTGQWMLIADHARDDDQVVEHRGSTVLLVDPVAQSALDGVQVDCVETTEGDLELILVAQREGVDEDTDDDLEEMDELDEDNDADSDEEPGDDPARKR
jgi:Fe-S cluster assembly iron-binding protein IscA